MGPAEFFFVVHNRNHVRIFAPVAKLLGQRGFQCKFVHLEDIYIDERAGTTLRELGLESFSAIELAARITPRAVVVVGNDWGPRVFCETLVRLRADAGARLIGIVDGCRFGKPHAYTLVDEVLAWGPSAAAQIKAQTRVVGSPAIEAAAWDESTFDQPPFVAVNYKFTYGSFDENGLWLSAVSAACARAGIRLELSQHPSDRVERPEVSFRDMDMLLRGASLLVSRSSTTVYEALARCKPVVLFPTPGEQLCEFADPMGAYEIARDASELPDMISRAIADIPKQADRARRFLAEHVMIGTRGEATRRITERLVEIGGTESAAATA